MRRVIFVFINCSFISLILALGERDHEIELDRCVQNLRSENRYISERFSADQAAWLCRKSKEWRDNMKQEMFYSPPIFTTAQHQYLAKLRNCDLFDECFASKSTSNKKKRETNYARVTRKEYRAMTDEERDTFHTTLNLLKTSAIDGVSKYNLLIIDHYPQNSPEAHWGCAFAPFHRELLKQMEIAMRLESPDVFLPYWDPTLDQGLPDPCDSVLWTEDFAGNGNGQVVDGPYKNWKTTVSASGTHDRFLYRNCGASKYGELFSPSDIKYFESKSTYEDLLCHCKDATFEMNHGLVHEYVGGHMMSIPISPNDPIFFQLHAFVDYIFEKFRMRQNETDRETEYPRDELACAPEHGANETMHPFIHLKNIDGLRNIYTEAYYTYAPSPTCQQGCTWPYLFCDKKRNRCLSTVKVGGNCTGYDVHDGVCFNSFCGRGVCMPISV